MAPHEELLRKIALVRGRWKTFLWLRGLAWVLGVTVISLLIGLALANSTSISGWTITALRLGLVAAFIFTVFKALVLPLRRTPTDTQLARFVEEKNPGLDVTNGGKQSRRRSGLIILDANLYGFDRIGEKVHKFFPRKCLILPPAVLSICKSERMEI